MKKRLYIFFFIILFTNIWLLVEFVNIILQNDISYFDGILYSHFDGSNQRRELPTITLDDAEGQEINRLVHERLQQLLEQLQQLEFEIQQRTFRLCRQLIEPGQFTDVQQLPKLPELPEPKKMPNLHPFFNNPEIVPGGKLIFVGACTIVIIVILSGYPLI